MTALNTLYAAHKYMCPGLAKQVQYTLDLRKPDLRKNLDLRKIVATTNFLVHKLFELRKILKAYCLI